MGRRHALAHPRSPRLRAAAHVIGSGPVAIAVRKFRQPDVMYFISPNAWQVYE
jgi:hypothetical protein